MLEKVLEAGTKEQGLCWKWGERVTEKVTFELGLRKRLRITGKGERAVCRGRCGFRVYFSYPVFSRSNPTVSITKSPCWAKHLQ